MFEWLKRKGPEPRSHEIVTGGKRLGAPLANTGIRTGMWVVVTEKDESGTATGEEKVGIVLMLGLDGKLRVDLVNDSGRTYLSNVVINVSDCRQAKHSEIPSPRRPDIKDPKVRHEMIQRGYI